MNVPASWSRLVPVAFARSIIRPPSDIRRRRYASNRDKLCSNEMVNEVEREARGAMQELAIGYAPAAVRPALAALLALDRVLGAILQSTREPLLGQMRLTWWHDALMALADRPPPAEPVLVALAAEVLPRGIPAAALAGIVDGWEALLTEPLDAQAIECFAQARGGGVFGAAAMLLGAGDEVIGAAGEGWALADLAGHLSDTGLAHEVAALAHGRFDAAFAHRWSRPGRPLGALALLARADLADVPPASPRRVARLLRHRLTGR